MTNEEIIDRLKVIKEINEVDPAMIDNGDVIALEKAIESILFTKEVESILKTNEFPEYVDEDIRTLYHTIFLTEVTNEDNK